MLTDCSCMLWESVADTLILMDYLKKIRLYRQIIRIIDYQKLNKYPASPPCVCAPQNKEYKAISVL